MKKTLLILAIFSTVALGVSVKQNISLNSFNAGELSPLINSRSDIAQYKVGAKTLENMLVRSQGPIQRRPGTQYIATAKNNTNVRLMEFEYSTELSYIIEAGHEYMRFYKTEDGVSGQIVDVNDDPIEITTVYDGNDIFELQYAQDEQYIRITHPDYQPYKLTRTADDTWTCTVITFVDGPFLKENTDTTSTITPSGTTTSSYQRYTTGDDSQAKAAGDSWFSQIFTTDESYDISGVKLRAFIVGTPNDLTVSIRAVSSSLPTGADLASGTYDCNDITTETPGEWIQIDFSADYTLTASTEYAIVARALTGDADNAVYLRDDTTSPSYSDGTYCYSTNAGVAWTAASGTDFMFETAAASDANESTITLEASDDIFDANHVGALWQISHVVPADTISGAFVLNWPASLNPPSDSLRIQEGRIFDFIINGTWNGTVRLQRSTDDGSTWEDTDGVYTSENSGNFQFTGQEIYEDADYRVYFDDDYNRTDKSYCIYKLTARSYINRGVVTIASVTDADTAAAYVETDLYSTDATRRWAEGAWSTYRGFPRTITHHEQRCVYGGSESYPETIWASIIMEENEDYDDFDAGDSDNDADAWIYKLPGNNPLQWMVSREYLMIGTTKGIGRLGQPDKPITPTYAPTFRMQAMNGCEYIQPAVASDTILFVERGGKKVREVTYTYTSERYVAPDLTILAEHITGDGITSIAWSERPDPVLYCIRDDGALLTLTYNPHYGITSWASHTTSTDEFESVAQIPGDEENEIWVAVDRNIDSNDLIYIERFANLDFGDQEDMWFVDSGGTDPNDLSHLEGETVCLLGDGDYIGDFTVSGGEIDSDSYTDYVVGLPYTSVLETLPLVSYDRDYHASSSYRSIISNLVLDLYETMDFDIGTSSDYKSTQSIDDLYTGLRPVGFTTSQFREPPIYIDCNEPGAFTLRGLTCTMETTYVE